MTVQIASEAMMPIGRSRPGRSVSSASVDTASKPMYAKKTIAAPENVPRQPLGWNGVQFFAIVDGDTYHSPSATKKTRTATLTTTIALLNRADSSIPRTRTTVIAAVMSSASRLKTIGTPKRTGAPPKSMAYCCGFAASAACAVR